jgi:hypothetical protein
MISLHERLAFISDVTNRLAAQRCELEQLRSEVGKAELRESLRAQAAASLGLEPDASRGQPSVSV